MGGQVIATRGGMIHLVLQLCRQFEDAFGKAIDGGKGGASFCECHTACWHDGWPAKCWVSNQLEESGGQVSCLSAGLLQRLQPRPVSVHG